MKQRQFHLRKDLDEAGNMRRLYAYIRSINPAQVIPPKAQAKANTKAVLKRVK